MPPIPGRVTVGIPTYKRPAFAERAARSVLAQTYPDLELVVSDDPFPGDDSAARIEALDPKGKLRRIVRQPHRLGLQANFDACIRLATGEYFLLLGDDDLLHLDAIASLVRGFTHPPAPATPSDVSMVWCPCNIVDAEGKLLWPTPPGPPLEAPERFLIALWRGNRGNRLSGILFRTQEGLDAGGFQQRFGDLCDTGIWGPAALAHPYVVCVPEQLVDYTNHTRSTTSASSPEAWRGYANAVHDSLLDRCRQLGLTRTERILRRHRTDHLFGVVLTILIQNIGQKGSGRLFLRELLHHPRTFFNTLMLRRLFKDGWKLLRLRKKSGPPTC
jgi:hypothetical protein